MEIYRFTRPLRSLFGVVVHPTTEFVRMKENDSWLGVYVYLCLGKIIVEMAHYFIEMKVIENLSFETLEPGKVETAVNFVKATGFFAAILIPGSIILKNLITAGIIYSLITFLSNRVEFKKVFSVSIHCWLILLIGRYFNLLILHLKGIENLSYLRDLKVNLGLDILLGGSENIVLTIILENITVFSIWHFIVMILGITIVANISRKMTIAIMAFVWIMGIAWKICYAFFNSNMGNMLG